MGSGKETNIKGPPGDVQEAPLDGQQYARQDATWVPVDPETSWDEVTGKPDTFPPTLPIAKSDVIDLPEELTALHNRDAQLQTSIDDVVAVNTTQQTQINTNTADIATKANINSPTLTGDPKAPTPATSDNDTSIATTAYVKANLATIVGGAIISDTPPASPQPGQLWYESDSANTYIWYADGDSSQWVQQNVQPGSAAGLPPDWLSSVPADLSYGFRTGPNRFVWNNNAGLTGTDVAVMHENGQLALQSSVGLTAATYSSLTVPGSILLSGGGALNFNSYFDTTWKASTTGWGSVWGFSPSTGDTILYRSTASAAANAALTMTPLLQFGPNPTTGGTKFSDDLYQFGTGVGVNFQHTATSIGIYKKDATGTWTWYKNSTGLTSGTGAVQLMALDNGGNLYTAAAVISSGVFTGSSSIAYLTNTGAGQIILRPNGGGSAVGQLVLDSAGSLTMYGTTEPTIRFVRNGTGMAWITASGTSINVFSNDAKTTGMYIGIGGSSWVAISDARLPYKVNATPVTNVLDRLAGVQLYTNEVPTNGKTELFFKAQELAETLPELVSMPAGPKTHDTGYVPDGPGDPNVWGVMYDRGSAVALQAVKELLAKIDVLEARIATLEAASGV